MLFVGFHRFFFACTASPENPSPNLELSLAWWKRQIKDAVRYVNEPAFRDASLRASLVNLKNSYSQARLENYNERKWGALPVWNPRVRRVVPSDIGQKIPTPDNSWSTISVAQDFSKEGLLELGKDVFDKYPAQLARSMLTAIADDQSVERYGLWRTDDWVGGLIWVETRGGVLPALTCATCHGSLDKNLKLVRGSPNHRFLLGTVIDDHYQTITSNSDWGPGRVDITPDRQHNPAVIADLRPVRYQNHLQRAATIKNSVLALAIRLETNSIAITGRAARAPRKAMIALSLYLWQLADELPPVPQKSMGRKVFNKSCASCHRGPGLSGPPTPIEKVGTDSSVASSPHRYTGTYQTPSLRGLSNRQRLTAAGSFTSVSELLNPSRTKGGHLYGQDLSSKERAYLLHFLNKL